ncbi:MAG: LuxR C-terminal-related transcriptional regulator [Humibacter sp.]
MGEQAADAREPEGATSESTEDRARVEESRRFLAELSSAVDAQDLRAVVLAVRAGWFELSVDHGEATRVLLERLPHPQLRTEPLLVMMLGICYNVVGFHRARALRYFQWSVRAARSTRPDLDVIDRALIRATEGAAYRLVGLPRRAVAPSRAAVRLLDGLSETDAVHVGNLTRVYSQVGVSLFYGGDVEGAMDAFTKGLAATPDVPPSPGFSNLAMFAGIHALRGDLPEARAHIEYARTGPWTDRQRNMYTGTFYRLAEAVIALERLDANAARAHLAAMQHDRRSIEHWIAIAQVEALAGMVEGDSARALAQLETFVAMRGREGRSADARHVLARTRALLQLALGNPEGATAHIERAASDDPMARVDRARIDLAMGKTGSALKALRSLAGTDTSARTAAEAAAVEAAVLLRFAPTARSSGVVQQLGSLLTVTDQRLAVALLPASDFQRVTAALAEAGYDVKSNDALRALLPDSEADLRLTTRERAVLTELMSTSSVAEIAGKLFVSSNTVKSQLRSVYRKLGVTNREDAIAVALDRRVLADGE